MMGEKMDLTKTLSEEFDLKLEYSQNLINLLDEGCTIPFISRYRKEMHGTCDDQTIRAFADRLNYLRNLEKRKEEVSKLITEQEKMTPEIQNSINNAVTLTEVEDIYRPFRPKRQTRATIAISKGLDPLSKIILKQDKTSGEILDVAAEFVNEEKGVKSIHGKAPACKVRERGFIVASAEGFVNGKEREDDGRGGLVLHDDVLHAVTEDQIDQLVAGTVGFPGQAVQLSQKLFPDANGDQLGSVFAAFFDFQGLVVHKNTIPYLISIYLSLYLDKRTNNMIQ